MAGTESGRSCLQHLLGTHALLLFCFHYLHRLPSCFPSAFLHCLGFSVGFHELSANKAGQPPQPSAGCGSSVSSAPCPRPLWSLTTWRWALTCSEYPFSLWSQRPHPSFPPSLSQILSPQSSRRPELKPALLLLGLLYTQPPCPLGNSLPQCSQVRGPFCSTTLDTSPLTAAVVPSSGCPYFLICSVFGHSLLCVMAVCGLALSLFHGSQGWNLDKMSDCSTP